MAEPVKQDYEILRLKVIARYPADSEEALETPGAALPNFDQALERLGAMFDAYNEANKDSGFHFELEETDF